jgi:hypothetical protein
MRVRRTLAIPLLVLFITSCGRNRDETGAPAEPVPAWAPDATLLEQLAPVQEVEGYQVRPPKGYAVSRHTGEVWGQTVYSWVGTRRPDHTAPSFLVMFLVPPPEMRNDAKADRALLDKMLGGVKRRRTGWRQTDTERGQVNGLTFRRARWSGTSLETEEKMQGFMYVAWDGAKIIAISSQDVEPHHEQPLKLAEAAALTFKKK